MTGTMAWLAIACAALVGSAGATAWVAEHFATTTDTVDSLPGWTAIQKFEDNVNVGASSELLTGGLSHGSMVNGIAGLRASAEDGYAHNDNDTNGNRFCRILTTPVDFPEGTTLYFAALVKGSKRANFGLGNAAAGTAFPNVLIAIGANPQLSETGEANMPESFNASVWLGSVATLQPGVANAVAVAVDTDAVRLLIGRMVNQTGAADEISYHVLSLDADVAVPSSWTNAVLPGADGFFSKSNFDFGGDQSFSNLFINLQNNSGLDEIVFSTSYADFIDSSHIAGYDGWAAAHMLVGGETDDDDDDGVNNINEYAFGGNPTNAADTGNAIRIFAGRSGGSNWIDCVYLRLTDPAGGVGYQLRQTENIAGGLWSNGVYVETGTADIGSGFEVVTNRFGTEEPSKFISMQVEKRTPGGTNSGTDPDFGTYSHSVESFHMDRTEITKAQWDAVYTWAVANGYHFDRAGNGKSPNHPVVAINWYDCVKWCNARSQMEGRTPCYTAGGLLYTSGQSDPTCDFDADGYRLPTNAEWEYAARGGYSSRRFPWGDTIEHGYAVYNSLWMDGAPYYSYDASPTIGHHPAFGEASPVGGFAPNSYGLYDMAGNVMEWCWDASGATRSIRGGSWNSYASDARCGNVDWYFPQDASQGYGFRTVCR